MCGDAVHVPFSADSIINIFGLKSSVHTAIAEKNVRTGVNKQRFDQLH